jgi:signal peptidase I
MRQRLSLRNRRRQAIVALAILGTVSAVTLRLTMESPGNAQTSAAHRSSGPGRGQIVMVNLRHLKTCARDGSLAVGRVVGLPGERVRVKAGRLLVDRHSVRTRPYLRSEERDTKSRAIDFPTQNIPKGQYLVLGEASNPGCDSRYFGPFPRYLLRAPVVPRLARASAFAQGFRTCANFGLAELAAVYRAAGAPAVARAVSKAQPGVHKYVIYRGCLSGLQKHKIAPAKRQAPIPIEDDGDVD